MNTRQAQECTQATLICLINDAIDSVVAAFREAQASIRVERERKEAYREYQKLNTETLRDIGMDDPQKQLRTVGRYL